MTSTETGGGKVDAQNRSLGQRVKRTAETKVMIPLAATVVSAAVSYLARKLPVILEEKVMPKLREQGASDKVTDVVEKVSGVVEQAPSRLAELSPIGGDGRDGNEAQSQSDGSSEAQGAPAASDSEREEERRRREERRQQRKRALEAA